MGSDSRCTGRKVDKSVEVDEDDGRIWDEVVSYHIHLLGDVCHNYAVAHSIFWDGWDG